MSSNISLKRFEQICKTIKAFFEEKELINNLIEKVSDGYAFCTVGDKLLDDYISTIDSFIGEDSDWFSWFVYENDLGNNEFKVATDKGEYIVDSYEVFYDLFLGGEKV
jgi:hypothetical protein